MLIFSVSFQFLVYVLRKRAGADYSRGSLLPQPLVVVVVVVGHWVTHHVLANPEVLHPR